MSENNSGAKQAKQSLTESIASLSLSKRKKSISENPVDDGIVKVLPESLMDSSSNEEEFKHQSQVSCASCTSRKPKLSLTCSKKK